MNRRESLALLVVAAAGQSLPALALARASDQSVAIYDGRYSEACEFAADAAMALDCRVDAALLWYASGLAAARHVHMVSGMTTAADALVIADCASRSLSLIHI